MRRGLLALLAVLAGVLLAATAAYAAGGTNPPLEYIRFQGENVQKTRLYSYDWHYRTVGGEWIHNRWTAPGYEWPTVSQVQPDTRINVVIRSARKPDKLTIRYYDELIGAISLKARDSSYPTTFTQSGIRTVR